MKKYLCEMIAIFIVFSLFGCVQINDVSPLKMKAITAGDDSSLAIASDGSLWAWGSNTSGKLGDGTATVMEEVKSRVWEITVDNNRKKPVKIMDSVVSVSAGFSHTMAITTDGSLWAWGYGDLGDGTTESDSPIKIMDNVVSVSAGFGYTMVIKTDDSLWAWGDNVNGQLGDGTGGHGRYNKSTPVKIMDSVASVSAGFQHTMAITTDGSLWAWGWNYNGQLGDGTRKEDRYSPVKIMDDVTSVSAGVYHTMAIKTDGSLWGWGANWNGELGDGTVDVREWNEEEGYWFFNDRPTPIKIMDSVASVSVSQSHTMAVMTDGSLWAWGDEYGASPKKIIDSVAMVSTALHTIALKTDGSVWAWGRNNAGQLGDGTTKDHLSPIKIIDNRETV